MIFDDSYHLTCQRSGCWMCFVRPNQTVQAGQVIGEICGIFMAMMKKVTKYGGLSFRKRPLVVQLQEVLLVSQQEARKLLDLERGGA